MVWFPHQCRARRQRRSALRPNDPPRPRDPPGGRRRRIFDPSSRSVARHAAPKSPRGRAEERQREPADRRRSSTSRFRRPREARRQAGIDQPAPRRAVALPRQRSRQAQGHTPGRAEAADPARPGPAGLATGVLAPHLPNNPVATQSLDGCGHEAPGKGDAGCTRTRPDSGGRWPFEGTARAQSRSNPHEQTYPIEAAGRGYPSSMSSTRMARAPRTGGFRGLFSAGWTGTKRLAGRSRSRTTKAGKPRLAIKSLTRSKV